MDYRKIIQVLRENIKSTFGEIFDQQLIESAVFAVEVENESYEQESQRFYKKILLNYLDNLYSSLNILNIKFFEEEVIKRLNDISKEPINDILILPGDFDLELNEKISLVAEIERLDEKIKEFLKNIEEIRDFIDNSLGPEPPRNNNKGPRL